MSRLAASHATVLDAFAALGHAVGHAARLRVLTLLAQAPKTVTMLAEATGESIANTSAHLAVLSSAGLVHRTRAGRHVRYSLADEAVATLVTSLRAVAEVVASPHARTHMQRFEGADVASLDPAGLHARLGRGLHLVDVRPEDEFAAGHLPGACSLPLPTLKARRARDLAPGPVLVYCRGRYCVSAVEGVRLLAEAGRDVQRLPFGVTEWKAAGFEVESC